jgi:hypothetical protein
MTSLARLVRFVIELTTRPEVRLKILGTKVTVDCWIEVPSTRPVRVALTGGRNDEEEPANNFLAAI